MTKLILTLFLLLPVCTFGQVVGGNARAGGNAAFGGAVPAGGGPSYIVSEGFEGTGAPSGWNSAGTTDWDEGTVYFEGAQALQLTGSTGDAYATNGFTAADQFYGFFTFYTDLHTDGDSRIFGLYNEGTVLVSIFQRATGVLRIQAGTSILNLTAGPADGTWARIWWRFKAGTADNAELEIWWSTDDTKPASSGTDYYRVTTVGTIEGQANAQRFYTDGITNERNNYFDKVRVDDVAIGSNPS